MAILFVPAVTSNYNMCYM